MNLEDRIIQTKIWLAKTERFPFFGYLLFMLIPRLTKQAVMTAGVGLDGQYLYYGEEFMKKLKDEEMRAVLVHEVLHLALGHLWRVGARERMLWNIAADLSINGDINGYTGMRLPKGVLLDKRYKGWSAEQIYNDLRNRISKATKQDKKTKGKGRGNKKGKGPKVIGKMKMGFADGNGGQKNEDMTIVEGEGNCGCRGDHSQWYKGQGNPKNKKMQKKWQRAVKQAADAHAQKQKGNLPGELQRLVEEAAPIVDWREVLVNYVVKSHDDFSYRQSDRRFLDSEFIMPSMEEGEKIDEVVIAVDTSGSISEQQLNKFAGEVKGLLGAFRNVKAYMCSIDTQVYDWKEINDYQLNIQYFGGGGTDYRCVFDEIEKRNIEPCVLIIMGDLYADFPDKEPNYDVIWLATRDHGETPGWGRKILYRD
jgi:predicted metal-dependent peptidase